MKKVYETPNVVITTFDSLDTTSIAYSRSAAAPTSTNKAKVTTTGTLG